MKQGKLILASVLFAAGLAAAAGMALLIVAQHRPEWWAAYQSASIVGIVSIVVSVLILRQLAGKPVDGIAEGTVRGVARQRRVTSSQWPSWRALKEQEGGWPTWPGHLRVGLNGSAMCEPYGPAPLPQGCRLRGINELYRLDGSVKR